MCGLLLFSPFCLGAVSTDDLNDFTDIYREHCEVSGKVYFHCTPPLDYLCRTTDNVNDIHVSVGYPPSRPHLGFVGSNIRLHICVVITQMVLCGC